MRPGACLAFLLAAATTLPAAGRAQEFTAEELCEGLIGFLKDKEDASAVGTLDLMAASFAKFSAEEQEKVVDLTEKVFGQRRDEGDDRLYLGALEALGKMGPLGQKATAKLLKKKPVKDRRDVLAAALRSLGGHQDPDEVGTIIDFLVYKEAVVIAAAAETLGDNYREQPEKVRKGIVEELIKNYATIASAAAANPREPHYKDRLNVVEKPMLKSLARLTGESFADAVEWQKWYNDNKRKKWKDLGEG